ncbi:suppressor of fused domain protein [Nocardia farcinica]|uniref:suppressor of fused domain protein n=1 Tax=Nocardia farcinica TaxID=37329 RepID=UPI001893F7BA|nr:suppressor of fused domain protein [Nocardia farcinica]MBF6252538.1 suppressor of fused domain protein [Nocardia farcinica]MBF6386432.1 suppressor of fused domain protein [Nocardia farcinica]
MDVLERVRTAVLDHFGVDGARVDSASVTFLGLEPIDILRIPDGDLVHYVTLGGARHPMGDPADLVADPVRGPRAELVLTLRASALPGLPKSLGVLVASPAVEGVVLQPDALLDLGEPMWQGSVFTAALLGESAVPDVVLPEPADPVRCLTVTPVTATEAAWVRVRGAQALRDAWAEAGIDVRDPNRGAASL